MAVPQKPEIKLRSQDMSDSQGGDCVVRFREPCPPPLGAGKNRKPYIPHEYMPPDEGFPEEKPEEIKPPETKPPAGEPSHIDLIQRILEQHETFKQILEELQLIVKSLATTPKPQINYYDTPLTAITVATPTQPSSPDIISNPATGATGYQVETIYATLQRIAPKITIINDGSDTLFVISSPEGKNWSSEVTILTGEARTFWNVFELRLRSPTAGVVSPPSGGVYRVIERDFWLAYTKPAGGVANRAAFTARSFTLALAATDYVLTAPNIPAAISIPNGFALVVRANVTNVGVVYVSAIDATVAATRITLNPGDTVKLFITTSALVHVAAANAGAVVDLLVEQ